MAKRVKGRRLSNQEDIFAYRQYKHGYWSTTTSALKNGAHLVGNLAKLMWIYPHFIYRERTCVTREITTATSARTSNYHKADQVVEICRSQEERARYNILYDGSIMCKLYAVLVNTITSRVRNHSYCKHSNLFI